MKTLFKITFIYFLLFAIPLAHAQKDAAMQAEHMAFMNLISDAMITHSVKRSGLWSDPNTWTNNTLPTAGANIDIPAGLRLEYDIVSDTAMNTMRVDGTLFFSANRNTRLVIDTIIVRMSGSFKVASEENRLSTNNTVEILFPDSGPINTTWDPFRLSRGLISHGKARIFGAKKKAFYKIENGVSKNSTSFNVEEVPSTWTVGDTIAISGVNNLGWGWVTNVGHTYFGTEDEKRVITAISGKTITIDQALQFDHLPQHAGMPIYVANYTRNVIFRTINGENVIPSRRAHTMFMHNPDVIVKGAGFYELGRTDKSIPLDDFLTDDLSSRHARRVKDSEGNYITGAKNNPAGRYAVHFHRTGGSEGGKGAGKMPGICEGNAVMGSPGWGFVSHGSHAVLENNASFDVFGAHFVSEDGDELGVFRDNIAIQSQRGSHQGHKTGTNIHDLGHGGHGYWFESRNILVEGNVAAGMADTGFHYFHRNSYKNPSTEINDLLTPFQEIAKGKSKLGYNRAVIHAFNNTVLASRTGFHVTKSGPNQRHQIRNMFDGLYAYNVLKGVHFEYTSKYTVRNFAVYADPVDENFQRPSIGFKLRNNTQDVALQNGTVHGFPLGISAGKGFFNSGHLVDTADVLVVNVIDSNNTKFINTIDSATDLEVPNDPDFVKILNNSDLVPNRLNFVPDNTLNVPLPSVGHWWNDTTLIPGTLTDSAGSSPIVLQVYNAEVRSVMIPGGYFTRDDNSKFVYVKHYIADRLTGDVASVMSTFEIPDSYIRNEPNLGQSPVAPSISTAPVDTRVALGDSLTFNCEATVPGYYHILYQWQKNGVDIPGAHYKDYTIYRVTNSDLSDKYRCKASAIGGEVTSMEGAVLLDTSDTTKPKAPSNLRLN